MNILISGDVTKLRLISVFFLVAILGSATPLTFANTFDKASELIDKGNFSAGLKILRPLALRGDGNAQIKLGEMYQAGFGVPKDLKEAIRWYRLAADQGNANAQFTLGRMYGTGIRVPKDLKEAIRWYRLAADQGNANAQFKLGLMYASGDGVPKDLKEAIRWYRLAADQGDEYAQYFLGVSYEDGDGVPKDPQEAIRWYRLAADQGNARAQYNLGLMYASGDGVPKDLKEAIRWYRAAADQGDEYAQFSLGVRYANGDGVPKDPKESVRWYRLAADQGNATAQFILGVRYDNGDGVPKDPKEAVRWYRLAAKQGNASAQFNLGVGYANGDGVPKDPKEAVRWYRLAAKQGHADAQFNLGVSYLNGEGIAKDLKEAVSWHRLAAELGHASAQHNLGLMYDHGNGVPKDPQEAVRWYRLAAEQGIASAQFNLGNSYANGDGVPKDSQEAERWYRLAAEQGYAGAQHNLGLMYAKGEGIPRDYLAAYFWILIASIQGDKDSLQARDVIERALTLDQRTSVQQRARNWKPNTEGMRTADPTQVAQIQGRTLNEEDERQREKSKASSRINMQVSVTEPDNDGSYTISIETNTDTASLKINGDEQGGKPDGRYRINRVARAGQETKLQIVAGDVFGNNDSKTILVNRPTKETKAVFSSLDPSNVKRQPVRDAVAIIIGISSYKSLPKAEYADDDARAFYDYAMRALGVKPENIKLLVDSDADEVEIIKAFKTWLPSRVKASTHVYVYYSGHGLPTEDGQGLYLLPLRAERDFISRTSIQFQEINADIQAAKPKSVTIFIDACYSGQARSGEALIANARPVKLRAEKKLFPDHFTVISASQSDQISSSSSDLKHGIFSYYLMKGMEGDADVNKDGKITLGEMQVYLVENVGRQAGMMSRKQEPQLIGDSDRVLVGR
jgi:TPR repeat protein